MSDAPEDKRNIVDWVYEMLPKSWQDRIYDRWFNEEGQRYNEGTPDRTGLIGRSQVYGDVRASFQQMADAHEADLDKDWENDWENYEIDGREANDAVFDQARAQERWDQKLERDEEMER